MDIWLANRYRLVAQPVCEAGIPETDNLCIDVMSIFNQCTGWSQALARQRDEDVILKVLQHIDFVVELIKPKKQIYIATDGEAHSSRYVSIVLDASMMVEGDW